MLLIGFSAWCHLLQPVEHVDDFRTFQQIKCMEAGANNLAVCRNMAFLRNLGPDFLDECVVLGRHAKSTLYQRGFCGNRFGDWYRSRPKKHQIGPVESFLCGLVLVRNRFPYFVTVNCFLCHFNSQVALRLRRRERRLHPPLASRRDPNQKQRHPQ